MSSSPPPIKRDISDQTPPPTDENRNNVLETNNTSDIHTNGTNGTNETKEEAQRQDKNGEEDGVTRRSKRRKLDDLASRPSPASRAASPPWKAVTVEGPTTVMVEGRRKSTRFIPPPPPDSGKRTTRGATAKTQNGTRVVSSPSVAPKGKANQVGLRKAASTTSLKASTPSRTQRTRKSSDAHLYSSPLMNGHPPAVKRGPGRPRKIQPPPTADDAGDAWKGKRSNVNSHNQTFTPPDKPYYNPHSDLSSTGHTPRLKLLLRRPHLPNRHPQHRAPPKPYPSFEEWLEHDDPLDGEDVQKITPSQAQEEAGRRLRIVEAAERGVLSEGRSSIYQPDEAKEPPPEYGHYNHVVTHVIHFGKLLNREKLEHQRLAKRLANEAVEKWKEKFKRKSEEEIEQEARDHALLRYKQLVKDIKDSWALVKLEIDKERIAKWEEEQLQLGHKVMDNMFTQAQEILGRNMLEASSSFVSEDRDSDEQDVDDDTGASNDDSEDENMSSSGNDDAEEEGNDEDAHLTKEQLLAKYGQLPDLPNEEEDEDKEEESEEAGQDGVDLETSHDLMMSEDEDRTPLPTPDRDLDMADADDASEIDLVTNHGHEESEQDKDREASETTSIKGIPELPYEITNGLQEDSDASDIDHEDPKFIDPARVELESVDEALLDSDDAEVGSGAGSRSGSEAWSDSDEESADDSDDASNEDEDEDAEGVMGFLAPDEIQKLKEAAKAAVPGQEEEAQMSVVNGVSGHGDQTDMELYDKPNSVPEEAEQRASDTKEGLDGANEEPHTDMTNGHDATEHVESMEVTSSKRVSISRSRHTSSPPRTEIPSLLRGTLREYQHDGLDWLVNLYDGETNGILADEMGLGKTIQTISLLAYLAIYRESWGPHLVVVPTSVMLNWEMEFKKWCPGFKILTYYGSIEERQRKRKGWLNDDLYNVVITSYQLILQDATAFKRRGWQYLILDEAHNIKNFKTQRWQTLLNFRTERRLLLTGTPLQNNIDELWSLLYFLMPAGFAGEGRIAGLEEFTMALKKPTNQILEQGRQQLDAEAQRVVKKLHEVLRPYLLRRLKADVEKQMPGKYEHVVYCRLSKRQRQLYDGFMGRADTKATLASGNYMSIINCLMSLRKVCNHPDLFETRQIVTSFAMSKPVAADFEIKDLLIRKRLAEGLEEKTVNLDFLGLLLSRREKDSVLRARRTRQIRATRPLEDLIERQTRRLESGPHLEKTSLNSVLSYMAHQEGRGILNHLETCLRHTRQRTQFMPIYGQGLIQKVTLNLQNKLGTRSPRRSVDTLDWLGVGYDLASRVWIDPMKKRATTVRMLDSLQELVPTLEERSQSLEPLIQKFSCVTPAVVANDFAPLALSKRGVDLVRRSHLAREQDHFHEPRVRLSIAFPDKRLLQYDCGKLQRLAILLRDLQAGGHRALIFTQMTRVLDILEQFLNIHGHRYLRLDGATKIEQRQILTDRFNTDPRILCFILSSRSGGLGINLTGADTVIFYDLDWNPAMDKQCQDRSHRIGQTRDVHIYKFVSEYTIEANILRKSNQKRLLDDVIIQKGDFTTDYFNKMSWRDAFDDPTVPVDEAGAAMDRVLGDAAGLGDVLQSVEEVEDATAAKVAQKEIVDEIVVDEEDFKENPSSGATPKDPASRARSEVGINANGDKRHVDEYMLDIFRAEYGHEPWRPPRDRDKKKARKGVDVHRVKRKRRV